MGNMLKDMPAAPVDRAEWLARQMVSLQFGDLIEELSSQYPGGKARLGDILVPIEMRNVAVEGLSILPAEKLERLLGNPDALLDLQGYVLEKSPGDGYWENLQSHDSELAAMAERSQRRRQDTHH